MNKIRKKNVLINIKHNQQWDEMVNEYHVECTSDKRSVEHMDSFVWDDVDLMMMTMRKKSLVHSRIDNLNRIIENKQMHQQHNWLDQD